MILRTEQSTQTNTPDNEPELQWLEDGTNYLIGLVFEMIAKICMLILMGALKLFELARKNKT